MKKPKITPRTRCAKMKIRVSAKVQHLLQKLARQQKTSPSEIAVKSIRRTLMAYNGKGTMEIVLCDAKDRGFKEFTVCPRLWSDDMAKIRTLAKKTPFGESDGGSKGNGVVDFVNLTSNKYAHEYRNSCKSRRTGNSAFRCTGNRKSV